ncbi:hypothetical protein PsYK624_089540 [Phanerochaete sordida]|uniref:Protein kinase domain-containing protein n=1 Tax=Phanerochaete sordida TaxID=48140 RepID=A0A9P3GBN0_9APHY|nr:hypothetical protein PsYK624_089540 [Phanerochaete sordida]
MTSNGSPIAVSPPRQLTGLSGGRQQDGFWREHEDWLREKGYKLHLPLENGHSPPSSPRLGRRRSERAAQTNGTTHEDAIPATRLSDGRAVVLRKVPGHADAPRLAAQQYLATWPLVSHPKNHAVPLLDALDVPQPHGRTRVLVVPAMQRAAAPGLQTVGEALDFLGQVLEGLQFMHGCNIAHRHCADLRVMADPDPLFPHTRRRSAHARQASESTSTGSTSARSTLRPVRYYLADGGEHKYEHGSRFRRAASALSVRSAAATVGIDDPYATDVRDLGDAIGRTFLDKLDGLDFLEPLIEEMTQQSPAARPDIDMVVLKFRKLQRKLHWWTLRARLVPKDEHGLLRFRHDTTHFFRTLGYIIIRRPAIPSFG